MKKLQKMNKAKRMFGKAHCNKGEYGLALLIACMLYVSCMPENIELPTEIKSVVTGDVVNVTADCVMLSGKVFSSGRRPKVCGVELGLSPTSFFEHAIVDSIGPFKIEHGYYLQEVVFTGLNNNTTYYYRSFAVDVGKYMYGDVRSFITLQSGDAEAMDLGLSVKWASFNVGAGSPEDYGNYYAWGETEEKSSYTLENYIYNDSNTDKLQDIGSNISGTSYDVAHVKWGGSWRMPTLSEIQELCTKCSWQWTEVNGIKGKKVTGPNGNSIFLPAAGNRYGTEVYHRGSYGYYWSGTLGEGNSYDAYNLSISSGSHDWYYYNRHYGHTVRPVTDK